MTFKTWLHDDIKNIVQSLEDVHKEHFPLENTIGFAGTEKIRTILRDFRFVLYPCVCGPIAKDATRLQVTMTARLRSAAVELRDLIEKAFFTVEPATSKEELTERAEKIVKELINYFPELRRVLQTDIQAAYNGDPATTSMEEILLSYPSIQALSIHRIAHQLYKADVPVIPRIMSEYAHELTGIDIHPGATIGEYFFIDHGTGVVIGETCTIGQHVSIYQGVTLGAKNFPLDEDGNPIKGIKRHPDIEDNVVIYAGATILGGKTKIGRNSTIGGNVWLTHSVPPESKIYTRQPE